MRKTAFGGYLSVQYCLLRRMPLYFLWEREMVMNSLLGEKVGLCTLPLLRIKATEHNFHLEIYKLGEIVSLAAIVKREEERYRDFGLDCSWFTRFVNDFQDLPC